MAEGINPETGHIIIDEQEYDSGVGDDTSSYTTSISSSVLNYPVENGRRYHAYREGTYSFPNDESEQHRMDLHHEMALKACDGKLHVAPLENPKRILDIGTGTGIWSVEAGDLYPDAEILGNDLSAVQPIMVPPNVKFEIDDVEDVWTYPVPFDYIHSRFMAGAISDWSKLIKNCFDNLEPGGIAEFQDGDFLSYSDDDTINGTDFLEWNKKIVEAADTVGRTLLVGSKLEGWLREAGFEDIHHEKIRLPVGIWPKDKKLKQVGAFNHVQLKDGLEGFSLALYTRVLGWRPEEVQALVAKVRKDLDDPKMHAVTDFHVVWGRKPA